MAKSEPKMKEMFAGVKVFETRSPAPSARARRRFAHDFENPKVGEAAFHHLHGFQEEIAIVRGLAAVIAKCKFKDPLNARPFADVSASLTALMDMLDDPRSGEDDIDSTK